MNKTVCTLVFLCIVFAFAGTGSAPDIRVLQDKGSTTTVEFVLNGYEIEPVVIEGKQCVRVTVPGNVVTHLEKGYPELPKFAGSVIIPDEGEMNFRIVDADYEVVNVNPIVPSKGNLKRNVDPSTVPYTWDNFYARDSWFPEQAVEVSTPFIMRDFRGQTVRFNAFQYNPARNELRVLTHAVVEINRIGAGGENVLARKDDYISKDFCPIYESFFLNYFTVRGRYPFLSEAVGNMLIITADAYYDNMAPFVFWKRKKGIPVEICSVSVIGNNSTSIKNKIQTKYNSGGVTWVLLVGEANLVATIAGSYDETCDPVYAYLAGSDTYLDAFICRFSASTDAHVDNQVARSVEYERYPPQGTGWAWYRKGIVTATSEGSPADSVRANWVRDTMMSYTYTTVTKVYEPWGTDAMITTAVNAGLSLFNHIGHGDETGFGSASAFWFDATDIANLTNTDMLPFVFLVACLTGDFDAVATCCCEAWMWDGSAASPQGAIAVYGASVLQSWVPPTVAQIHAMSLLKHETAVTIGGMSFNGSMHMVEQTSDLEMQETWHIFGDASLDLRTRVPDTLLVTHNSFIPPSASNFTVNVMDNNGTTPLQNALVCLWIYTQTPQVHAKGYTDASGNITFNVTPQNPNDTMWVTVTKHNYSPYEGYAIVQDVGMPAIPTVISPLDYARVPNLNPTLRFTSTDPQGQNLSYRVLWDTDPTFASPDSSTLLGQASGAIASFSFPGNLTNGQTYWWKVKCTDPIGSGIWTQYTNKRSFTIDTSFPASTCSWFQTTNAQFNYNTFNSTMVQGDSVILVPTGQTVVDTVFEEHFNSGMPSGWTVVNGNGDTYLWTVGTTSDLGSYTPPDYGTSYAYYSDDDAGSGVINNNEELISPKIYTGGISGTLEILYGYGLQIYETGEKLRVKFRKKTGGTWSAWSNIAEYTTSTSGSATIALTAQLPADSMQFEWFYSDSTASSHWGYACACDNVVLRYSYQLNNNAGTMTGAGVVYHDLSITYARQRWGDVVWRKASAGDSIGVQVEYYNGATWQLVPNGLIPGNSAGHFSSVLADTIKLTSVDTVTYNNLRLKALFYRMAKSPTNPALLDWEIGNLASFIGVDEVNAGAVLPSLSVYPTVFHNQLKLKYSLGQCTKGGALKIYDASGRVVKSFALNPLPLTQSIVWRGADDAGRLVPAGVYFVKLESADKQAVQKAVLLR